MQIAEEQRKEIVDTPEPEMEKIRREQGYDISHDANTVVKPPEVGTPAQRVSNWKYWMGTILLMENEKYMKR